MRCRLIRLLSLGSLLLCLSFAVADDREAAVVETGESCVSAVDGVFTAKTAGLWKSELPAKKASLLARLVAGSATANAGVAYLSSVRITTIKLASAYDEVIDPYGKWMIRAALEKSGGRPEVSTPGFALVGEPSAVIQVYRLSDGTVIGGRVFLLQSGAQKVGADFTTFDDIAQAHRKGYETRGRSWGIEFLFEETGNLTNGTPAWRWQGR